MEENKLYFNYHRHSYFSNVSTIDCTVSNEDYANRSKELGHPWLSSCEHGGTIGFIDTYLTAKKNNLKYIHVGEYYFVRDRFVEKEKVTIDRGDGSYQPVVHVNETKDKSNYHLILIAKTKKAFEEMNYIMSEANESGYYYKPRIDLELLRKLPKGEIYCTTACVGGFLKDYPNTKDILEEMIEIFGENFFLEVQPHDTEKQITYNQLMKILSEKYKLKLIGACDSHMIDEKGKIDRDYLLHSKGLIYPEEQGWFLDYPDYDTLFERFRRQGVWDSQEINDLINNTLLLTNTEEIIINTKMKVPTIFPDKDRDWKLGHLKFLIFSKWEEYRKNISIKKQKKYIEELLEEFNIIEVTKLEDYFLTNYYIVKKGVEYGGILTKTGRGSATSFLINFMLGFTTVDRLKAKVPMLRDRFIGIARILENNSCADLDINLYNREAFVRAQRELLGEHGSYPMVSWGTLGIKSSFKMLCRAKNIDADTSNEISKAITIYLTDKKHNDSAKIEDYIKNEEHLKIIEDSSYYNGIIDSYSQHPCSYILANEDIRRQFGLIRTPSGDIVANITGEQAEKLGYLKNDLLIVSVVGMNDRLYKRIGIKQFSSEELYEKVKDDKKVWDLYANGFTQCLNQMDSASTTEKAKKCKPLSVEDLCNLVAIIRPACRSIYPIFEKKEKFEYGISELDKLLQGEYLESSLIIYQEQIMQILEWLGFPESDGYTIMKAISKKKSDVIASVKEKFEEKLIEEMIKDILKKETTND